MRNPHTSAALGEFQLGEDFAAVPTDGRSPSVLGRPGVRGRGAAGRIRVDER